MAFALLALLLLAQDPAAGQPMATAKEPAPAEVAPIDRDYLPQGAPSDDFAFVAWCKGVLTGHMDLAERIQPVLPLDDAQQTIGRAYLRAYDKALAHAAESRTDEGKARAEAARADGWSRWEQARHADLELARDTYLGYQLPARCEHAAQRLSGDNDLFKKAFSPEELEAVRNSAPSSATLASGGAVETAGQGPVAMNSAPAPAAEAPPVAHDGAVISLRSQPDMFAPPVAATLASTPDFSPAPTAEDVYGPNPSLPAPAPAFAAAPSVAAVPTDVGGAKVVDAGPEPAEAAKVEKVAAVVTPAPPPAKAEPAKKPETKRAEAAKKKPAPKAEKKQAEAKKGGMPSKGHLLPGFLRKKKDGEG